MKRLSCFVLLVILAGCDQSGTVDQPGDDPVLARQMQVVAPADTKPWLAEFTGKVVKIVDGDTIDVLNDGNTANLGGTTVRIRMNGIDCPELSQPFGNNARQFVSTTIGGGSVRIVPKTLDKSGRTIGDVFLLSRGGTPDLWVNRELVRIGLAWHYKPFSGDERLAEDEHQARLQDIGLWVGSHQPIPPWVWRQLSKEEPDEYR